MMSQNRAAERDRYQAQADYDTNVQSEQLAEQILARLERIEDNQIKRLVELAELEGVAREAIERRDEGGPASGIAE